MVADNIDCLNGAQIMELLFAVLGSGQDKASDDFQEMVVSVVDKINSSPRHQKEIEQYKRKNYDWKPVQNILKHEFDGKIIECLGSVESNKANKYDNVFYKRV
jgi:hypothetical protein